MKARTILGIFAFLAGSGLVASGQNLLLQWNFDEAAAGSDPTTDHGIEPKVDGRFFQDATRTSNTPAGYSTGALDVTAGLNANVLANHGHPDVDSLDGKLDNLESFTLTTWVNMRGDPAANQRILRGGSNAGFGIRVVNPPEGNLSAGNFGVTMDLLGGGVALDGSIDADDRWVFMALTFDSSLDSGQVRLFTGDTLSSISELAAADTGVSDTGELDDNFAAGRHPGVSNRGVPALLDDVRIYSGAADEAFIEDIRLANIPEPGTIGLLFGAAAVTLAVVRRRSRRSLP